MPKPVIFTNRSQINVFNSSRWQVIKNRKKSLKKIIIKKGGGEEKTLNKQSK